MSNYIGNYNPYGKYEKQVLTGLDGQTAEFDLTYAVGTNTAILVMYNGYVLTPGVGYELASGSRKIKFFTPPMAEDDINIIYLGKELTIPRIAGIENGDNSVAVDADNNTVIYGNYWMPYTDNVISIGSFPDGSGDGEASLNRIKNINTSCLTLANNSNFSTQIVAADTQNKNTKWIFPAGNTVTSNTNLAINSVVTTDNLVTITLAGSEDASGNYETQDNKKTSFFIDADNYYYPPDPENPDVTHNPSNKDTAYPSMSAVSDLVKDVSDTINTAYSPLLTSITLMPFFERYEKEVSTTSGSYIYQIPSGRTVIENSIMVFLNGVLLRPGSSYDYQISVSDTITITLLHTPTVASNLTVTYWYRAS